MAALGDDCYFFCTSTCAKGAACPFRHVESARTCRIICQHWQMGGCLRPMCKFRHSDFMMPLDTTEALCYWEALPTGCVKKHCTYKHLKPRPQDDANAAVTELSSVENSTVGAASSKNEVVTTQNLVQPVVTPVIIQPSAESEESNSSPMKRPPESTPAVEESKIQTSLVKEETDKGTSDSSSAQDDSIPTKTVKKKKKKAAAVVNKVKQNIAEQNRRQKKVVGKVTAKMKAQTKSNLEKPRKSVKQRLGRVPLKQPVLSSSEKSDNETSSDSDGSVENIKVMSMEEIFRQKALESMLQKRATEGKASLTSGGKRASITSGGKQASLISAGKRASLSAVGRKTSAAQKKVPIPAKKFEKPVIPVKKAKHVAAPVESSSSEEESESSDGNDNTKQSSESSDENDNTKLSSWSSSSSSSSGTSSASSSSENEEDTENDSEELDVRRVVVDLEGEKAARNKAKESFLKKQKLNARNAEASFRKKQKVNTTNAQIDKNRSQVIRPAARKVDQMPLRTLDRVDNRERHQRKHHIDIDYDSDDIVSSRIKEPLKLSVRDRLGKSTALHKVNSDAQLLSRAQKFRSVVSVAKPVAAKRGDASRVTVRKMSASSSSDDDPLADVKVKTLEEIRLEKMRKHSVEESKRTRTSHGHETAAVHKTLPVKQRLGNIPEENKKNTEVDDMKGRQVVLMNDTGSKSDDASDVKPLDEQKKARKRPWRSHRRAMDSAEAVVGDDERTAVVADSRADGGDYGAELGRYKDEHHAGESSFERMRRKALMKKLQSRQSKILQMEESVDEVNISKAASSETAEQSTVVEADSTAARAHKHKHSHKHHKRGKIERQIYLPPAMKNTVTISEASPIPGNLSPKRELPMAPTAKVSPLKRGPHPIAAAWAAGLALSSKGMTGRRPETTPTPVESSGTGSRLEVRERLGVIDMVVKPKEVISSSKMSEPPSESTGVTIKSFSEIMAEKRKRRLELQAQKSGSSDLSAPTASISSSTAQSSLLLSTSVLAGPSTGSESNFTLNKAVDAKPRVPISPIVFTADHSSHTAARGKVLANSYTSIALKATVQPLGATHQKAHPDIPSFSARSTASTTSTPHITQVDQKVKLKSTKSPKNNGVKKKKGKKLFAKKNLKEQIDQNCIVTSEDSNSILPPLFRSSIPSENVNSVRTDRSQGTTSQHTGSSSTTHAMASTYLTLSGGKAPSSQTFQNTSSPDKLAKVSTKTDNAGVKTQSAALTSKHSALSPMDSEIPTKKANFSVEDEFNFFEDEDMNIYDAIIPDNIEPIDDLLQDIDNLLS